MEASSTNAMNVITRHHSSFHELDDEIEYENKIEEVFNNGNDLNFDVCDKNEGIETCDICEEAFDSELKLCHHLWVKHREKMNIVLYRKKQKPRERLLSLL